MIYFINYYMYEFVSIIVSIIALVYAINLSNRIRRLEGKFGIKPALEEQREEALKKETSEVEASQMSANETQDVQEKGPGTTSNFAHWLREDWMLKVGAFLLLIGLGWFVNYAFANNWIGPMGRIALGLAGSALILIFGWWRIRSFVNQGSVILVLGSTGVLLTILAAREIYGFFTPTSALLIMFLSTAFVALASVKHGTQALAFLSLVLAGVAPLLTNTNDPSIIGLFSYLFVVTVGTVWIVTIKGWRALTTAALILISFYSFPYLDFRGQERNILLLFSFAFAAVFFVTNTLGLTKAEGKKISPDLITAGGNGMFLLAWIMTTAPADWQSLLIVVWMILFTVGAFILYRVTGYKIAFYTYAGIGVAMLATATAAELSGPALTIAYIIESAVISLIGYVALGDVRIGEKLSLLMIGPVALSFTNISSRAWRDGVFHEDFFVLLLMTLSLSLLGLLFISRESEEDRGFISSLLLITGSIYAYLLLWLSLHSGLSDFDVATMISLVVYTIIGLVTYIYGRLNEIKSLMMYGGILIAFVVGRLLLVEVWQMNLAGRIVTFFIIGILLMSTAFIGRHKKEDTQI